MSENTTELLNLQIRKVLNKIRDFKISCNLTVRRQSTICTFMSLSRFYTGSIMALLTETCCSFVTERFYTRNVVVFNDAL